MPMIDAYAAAGTFGDPHALAQKLASDFMAIEQVPDLPMFRKNTAAFVHELPPSGISNVVGVGDVRLADEHRRSRGMRRSIGGLRRSGRHVGRGTRDAARNDPELYRAVLRCAPGAFLGPHC
jgi:hypothetical protein